MAAPSDLSGNMRDVTRLITMWTHVEVFRNGADFEVTFYTIGGDRQSLTLAGSFVDLDHAIGQAMVCLVEEARGLDRPSLARG